MFLLSTNCVTHYPDLLDISTESALMAGNFMRCRLPASQKEGRRRVQIFRRRSLQSAGDSTQHVRLCQKCFDSGEKLFRVSDALLDPIELGLKEHIVVGEDPVVLFIGQNFRQR